MRERKEKEKTWQAHPSAIHSRGSCLTVAIFNEIVLKLFARFFAYKSQLHEEACRKKDERRNFFLFFPCLLKLNLMLGKRR